MKTSNSKGRPIDFGAQVINKTIYFLGIDLISFRSYSRFFRIILIFFILILSSCKGFLDVLPPDSKIPNEIVFTDGLMAESALTGIYLDTYTTTSFAGGSNFSVVSLAGLSADELKNNPSDPTYLQFQNNNLSESNTALLPLWNSMYKMIYQANSALEGLDASKALTPSMKQRLTGEALFLRAFSYFYLTNLFGSVPLALTTDYEINSRLTRSTSNLIYGQIVKDLSAAESLLPAGYVNSDRIRPNQSSATALLARVYLYNKDWSRAEDKATNIISNSTLYGLEQNLTSVFLSGSREAIWQLRPTDVSSYTNEGYYFSIINGPQNNVLRDNILQDFDGKDKRKDQWITSISSGGKTIYLPYKYKRYVFGTGITTEYSMVLRLAEIYLIRAEAKVKQHKLDGALYDLNMIHQRAGLDPLIKDANLTEDDIMAAIQKERKLELLTEWGHRWLDLKRWSKDVSLTDIKTTLSQNALLYPVPSSELSKNPALNPQNTGY